MLSGWFPVPVGIDPVEADRLRRALDEAAADLAARSARVQVLLDEAGIVNTVPGEIRDVGGWCGGQASTSGDELQSLEAAPSVL